MRTYFFSRKQTIVILRWLLFILLGYILLLGEDRGMSASFYALFLGGFAASNLFLGAVSEESFTRKRLQFASVIFDILFITASIYISGDLDLYVIYFLTVLMAAFGRDLRMSIFISVVAAAFYALLSYRYLGAGFLLNNRFLLRIPFFYVVALITSFLSQEANVDRDRLVRTERLLSVIRGMNLSRTIEELITATARLIIGNSTAALVEVAVLETGKNPFAHCRVDAASEASGSRPRDTLKDIIPPRVADKNLPFEIRGPAAMVEYGLNPAVGTQSCLLLPVMGVDAVVAWIAAYGKGLAGFNAEEVDFLKLVAGNLSSELARVQEKLRTAQRAGELEAMIEVSQTINQSLDLADVLDRIVQVSTAMMEVEAASIILIDDETKDLVFEATSGVKAEEVKKVRLKAGQGVAGWVAREAKPLIVNDARHDERFFPLADRQTGFNTQTLAAVPLRGKSRVIGVLEVINKKAGMFFGAEDISVLEGIASQASMAIERARLYRYMEEQTNETIEMYLNLEKEKSRVETILASMGEAVLVCNETGEINLVNRRGRALGEEICRTPDGQEQKVAVTVEKMLKESMAAGNEQMAKVKVTARSEIFQLRTTPIITSTGKILGGVAALEDVTEMHRLNELKTEFLSHISHELRTPLTSVAGAVSVLLRGRGGEVNPQQATLLNMIKEESNHLVSLVNNLLDLSRLELGMVSLNFEPRALSAIIQQGLAVVAPLAEEKNIILDSSQVGADLPEAALDADGIKRVIINLIGNAVKFTPEGGRVAVGAGVAPVAEKGKGQRFELQVWVSDNGMGIPPQDIDGIFEKFYRSKTARDAGIQGTGLGLALCRQIVQAHGGRIWVASEPGRGSTFTFSLPVM